MREYTIHIIVDGPIPGNPHTEIATDHADDHRFNQKNKELTLLDMNGMQIKVYCPVAWFTYVSVESKAEKSEK